METTTCPHKHCGRPVDPYYARYKFSEAHGAMMAWHTSCSYAHPDYDVSKGSGSPFTTITASTI